MQQIYPETYANKNITNITVNNNRIIDNDNGNKTVTIKTLTAFIIGTLHMEMVTKPQNYIPSRFSVNCFLRVILLTKRYYSASTTFMLCYY